MSVWQFFVRVARSCLRKEGLAFIALMVSLGGAAILSFMLWGNLIFFRKTAATEQLFYLSCGMLVLIGIVLMSSHRLLGSKLSLDLEFWKLKAGFRQGEEPTEGE